MKMLRNIFFILVFFCFASTAAQAAIPHLINYQGRLTDTNGVPLTGSYNLNFKIYDAESAGNLLWEESQSSIVVDKGIFGVYLGAVTTLNLAFDIPYFLEIKVGNEVMSPRQRITSAGYAMRAEAITGSANIIPSTGNTGFGTLSPAYPLTLNTGGWGLVQTGSSVVATYSDSSSGYIGTMNNMNFQILTNSAAGKFVVTTDGKVGVGTSTPSNIFSVQQNSATDPIADSWLTYPCDRTVKEVLGEVGDSKLDKLKQVKVYNFKRKVMVTDDEVKKQIALKQVEIPKEQALQKMSVASNDAILKASIIEKDGKFYKTVEPTKEELDKKKDEIRAFKSNMPKFKSQRVGVMIDDPEIPPEILNYDEKGNIAGIDLLAYIGYLHAALKEAGQRIDNLEAKINQKSV